MTHQVGDKVLVRGSDRHPVAPEFRGQVAEVIRITQDWIRVRLNGGRELYFLRSQLEKADGR